MKKNLSFAFQKSLPILFGYVFLGFAFGVLLTSQGFSPLWAFLFSLLVYSGSLQMLMVSLLSGGAALSTIGLMTLLVNFRHIFYGLSFLDKLKKWGKFAFYPIFALTDETYSVLCACEFPQDVDENQATFLIALLNHSYWVLGSLAGALAGAALPFDLTGIDFSMTALFIVLLIEQWKSFSNALPAWIGLGCGGITLMLLGPDAFLAPALIATVCMLMLLRNAIERRKA